jgi:hypothetical protein
MGTFGIRIGIPNRDQYFKPSWIEVGIEIDGVVHQFAITPGFWNQCPELRDSGGKIILNWLLRNHSLKWPKGKPPRFELKPLSEGLFRLVK